MTEEPVLDLAALAALGIGPALIDERRRLDGDRADQFLLALPALAQHWQARLGLRGAGILPGGVLSVALACRRGEEPVVLKLSAPQASNARAEAVALAAWDGRGACRLRWASDDGRVMLLDAIVPGLPVTPGIEARDVRRAAAVLGALHRVRPIPQAIPDAVQELGWRFDRAHRHLDGPSHARGLLDHADIDAAHGAALALHHERPESVLCHGDFINKNLLIDSTGHWWAIDPRPCAGDPCLDAGFWALAHRPGRDVPERCRTLAAAARLDGRRVWAWARAFAVSEAVLVTHPELARAHYAVWARTSDLTR